MKRTNRQKNSIIVGFILSTVILIICIFIVAYKVVPSILDIESKKKDTLLLQQKIKEISNKGLSFNEFIELKSILDDDDFKNKEGSNIDISYLKKLIEKLDKDFFEGNFTNTGSIGYTNFLTNKSKSIEQKEDKDIKNSIKRVLPNYSSNLLLFDEADVLTDFKFINFLEDLFYEFDLNYDGNLGIKNLVSLDSSEGDLETSIFYIPVEFKVLGKKADIINFIHYFENVGNVIPTDTTLKVYKDDFIKDDFGNEIKVGNNKYISEDKYNIYNNQVADISEIKMVDYLDSSYKFKPDNLSFTDFIKQDIGQKDELYEIEIGLRFYTIGAQNYKIREQITKIIDNYKGLLSAINKKIKELSSSKKSKDLILVDKLKDLSSSLGVLNKEIVALNKELAKSKDLNAVYKKAMKYDEIIDNSSIILGEKIYDKVK